VVIFIIPRAGAFGTEQAEAAGQLLRPPLCGFDSRRFHPILGKGVIMVTDNNDKKDQEFTGDSDLYKAVSLLEENGFYVVHADTESYRRGEHSGLEYTGALLIRAYPRRLVKKAIP
jgi:hypothetical protein